LFSELTHTLVDVKTDNILVDWHSDKEGYKTVSNAALGDFDLAFKCENAKPCNTPYAIGNAMWRSPEGQTGKCVNKASDIYSFGLVVSQPYVDAELRLTLCKVFIRFWRRRLPTPE
jgi:serine/threonine protein kinase